MTPVSPLFTVYSHPFSLICKKASVCLSAAQRGQQRPGLVCGGDGDIHQSGAHRGHVCGRPGEARPGPGKTQNLNPYCSVRSEKYVLLLQPAKLESPNTCYILKANQSGRIKGFLPGDADMTW